MGSAETHSPATGGSPAARRAVGRADAGALPLLLGAFGSFGGMLGGWQVLLPDLSGALALSPGPLGTALSLGLAAAVPMLLVGGRAVDRWGVRAVIVAAGVALALVLLGAARVGTTWGLIALLMAFFAAIGLYDIGINAAAVRLEQRRGGRLVPYCHAAFSGGAATGALAAGLLVAGAVPFRAIYVGIALLLGGVMAAVWCGPLPAAAPVADAAAADRAPRLTRSAALWIAAGISAVSFVSEATLENWSALYLREALALPAILGASGVATFHLAMTVGRLSAATVLRRVRRLALLRGAGLLAVAGMALTLATTAPPLILCGFLIVGLAFSGIVPVAVSLAGDLFPARAGQATSLVFTVSYTVVLVAPGAFGLLAEATGLRAALAALIATATLIALLTMLPAARRDLGK